MICRQISEGPCRSYLLVSEKTREAVLVDPLLEHAESYLETLRREGLKLRLVIDTHTHADHLSACAALRDRTGVDYLMHRDTPVSCATRRVSDGEILGLGDLTIRFLHTPGHTADSLTLSLGDRVLSGDFLFIGSYGAGRLDLPGSDPSIHFDSLAKLDAIPDSAVLLPAHDYQGLLESTMGAERKANPVLARRGREEYLRWWSDRRFGASDWMIDVIKANAACTRDPHAVAIPKEQAACACAAAAAAGPASPALPQISAPDLAVLLGHSSQMSVLLDVRTAEEFTGELGHIDGSVLIPVDELESRVQEVPPGPIISICRSGKRAARAAELLQKAGRNQILILAGGMLAWNDARLPVRGVNGGVS